MIEFITARLYTNKATLKASTISIAGTGSTGLSNVGLRSITRQGMVLVLRGPESGAVMSAYSRLRGAGCRLGMVRRYQGYQSLDSCHSSRVMTVRLARGGVAWRMLMTSRFD